MKKIYLATILEEKGKYYSHIIPCYENDNLLELLNDENYTVVLPCTTKKLATDYVEGWRMGFKNQGNYMF
jgi:hypothetical protein